MADTPTPRPSRRPSTEGLAKQEAGQVWDEIERTIDERVADLRTVKGGRVWGMNVPFGAEDLAIDAGAGKAPAYTGATATTALFVMRLGIDFPSRLIGWRLDVTPAGSLSLDVTRRPDTGTEKLIVPAGAPVQVVAGITAKKQMDEIFDAARPPGSSPSSWEWPVYEFAVDDVLGFYITAADTVETFLFRLRFREIMASA